MSTTTIETTPNRVRITTTGFGFNTLYRHPEFHAELWQWHAAVADAVANHHAQVMGHFFPCPTPESTPV